MLEFYLAREVIKGLKKEGAQSSYKDHSGSTLENSIGHDTRNEESSRRQRCRISVGVPQDFCSYLCAHPPLPSYSNHAHPPRGQVLCFHWDAHTHCPADKGSHRLVGPVLVVSHSLYGSLASLHY